MVVLTFLFQAALAFASPSESDLALRDCLALSAPVLAQKEGGEQTLRGLLYRLAWWERAPSPAVSPDRRQVNGLEWKKDSEVWRDEYQSVSRSFVCRPWAQPRDHDSWVRWESRKLVLDQLSRHPEAQPLLTRLLAREHWVSQADMLARKGQWKEAFALYRKASQGLARLPAGLALRLAWSGTEPSLPYDDLAVRASFHARGGSIPQTVRRLEQRICSRFQEMSLPSRLAAWDDIQRSWKGEPQELWQMTWGSCPLQQRWSNAFALLSRPKTEELAREIITEIRSEILERSVPLDVSWLPIARAELRTYLKKSKALARQYASSERALIRRGQSLEERISVGAAPVRIPLLELEPHPDFGPVPALPPAERVSFVREWESLR